MADLTHISRIIPPLMEQIEALQALHRAADEDEAGHVMACDPDFWPEVAV